MSAPHRLSDQSPVLIRKAKALAKTIVDSCTEAEAARALAKMQALIGIGEIDRTGRPNVPEIDPLDVIIPLSRAVELSGLSDDSWRRHHKDKFVRLSERRIGIRMRDALMRAE